jgi:hypothetical protein
VAMTATAESTRRPAPMHTVVMMVGPDQAIKWLESNLRNRPMDQKHVDYLIAEMKAGRWKLTHHGIAFDINGVLQDGQHRLWAIVLSGCTVEMNVTFNTPEDCIEYVDGGRKRKDHERMQLSGRYQGKVSKDHVAALRAMLLGVNEPRPIPFCREMDLMARHKPAVDFAVEHLTTNRVKGVGSSATRAAVARAWYSADLDRLRRFCDVLRTGMRSANDENVIILLRDYLAGCDGREGLAQFRDQYGKVQRALHAYLGGKTVTVLRACAAEMFPLPEEQKKVA